MPPPAVSIVIVNHDGREWLARCLRALAASPPADAEILVVDNGSRDGSVEMLSRDHPGVQVLALPDNLGVAAANNRGAAIARGDLLAFLNNDTEPEPGWLEALRAALATEPDAALAAARLVYAHVPTVVDSAGDGFSRWGAPFKRGHGEPAAAWDVPGETFGASGAACLIRRAVFEEAGRFDEAFFLVFEDADLSYRVRLGGHRCLYVPDAVVRHVGSATLGRLSALAVRCGQRNVEAVYIKNTPAALLFRSLPAHGLYILMAAAYFLRQGLFGSFVLGKWDAVRRLPDWLRQRRTIQRRRTVSAAALRAQMTPHLIRLKWREKRFERRLAREARNSR